MKTMETDHAGPALVCCPHDDSEGPCCGMASVDDDGQSFTCPECGQPGVADYGLARGRGSRAIRD